MRAIGLAVALALLATAPAAADIKINEIESQDLGGGSDWVELINTGAAPVNIGNYLLKDSGNNQDITVPAGTTIAGGGLFAINVTGLGNPDTARLYTSAGGTLLDSYSWAAHAAATYGRCPDGSGAITWTSAPTRNAVNACAAPAAAWQGGVSAASLLDDLNAVPDNFSGLAYQGSGTSAPGVLWGVRNNPGTLYRYLRSGAGWTINTAGGWSRTLAYGNGAGNPDAEGVTRAGGDANGIYVSVERDGSGGSDPAILRYDVTSAAIPLKATNQWALLADLPGLDANASLEAIGWMPDSLLVAKGLREDGGGLYDPANYAAHGDGLFFVGVEQDGRVIGYALNRDTDLYTRVVTIASGFPAVMDLEFEPETGRLWAACDDTCDGETATLEIAQSGPSMGKFVVTHTFARPAGMANLNNEGFAIAPQSECKNGVKPTFYADDSNTDGHSLRGGTIACAGPGGPDPTPTPSPSPSPTPSPTATASATPVFSATPTATPVATPKPPDVTKPSLKLGLKFAKTLRQKGKFAVTFTLSETADLTITAKVKSRSLYKATRKAVKAGKTTVTLTLTKKVKAKLRKGQTVTLSVVARDAAGNATTSTAKAKVP